MNQMKTEDDKIEFNKLQGFDVLEKLPEEKLVNTYNHDFYSSLSNMKFVSCSIPDEFKLFYRFEQNENVPVTTTAVQLFKTFQELFAENESIKQIFKNIQHDILSINSSYDNYDTDILDDIEPEIRKLEANLRNFLVNQKTENFKLIKELGILEKEKNEIQVQIVHALERLNKIEQDVGAKGKVLSYVDENKGTMTEQELSAKFNVIDSNKV